MAFTNTIIANGNWMNKRVVLGKTVDGAGTAANIETGLSSVEFFCATPTTDPITIAQTTALPSSTGTVNVDTSGACTFYWMAVGV